MLPVNQSIIYLPTYLPTYLCVCQSSTNQSVDLSTNQSFICLSTSQSVYLVQFLTSTSSGSGQHHTRPLYPQERPRYPSNRRLAGSPRGGLDDLQKKKNNVPYLQSFVVHIHISFNNRIFSKRGQIPNDKSPVSL